jgi:hypothetical protein
VTLILNNDNVKQVFDMEITMAALASKRNGSANAATA